MTTTNPDNAAMREIHEILFEDDDEQWTASTLDDIIRVVIKWANEGGLRRI